MEADYSVIVREISDSPSLCAKVWEWHRRRPGWQDQDSEWFTKAIGSDWFHWLFFVDNAPTVCVSANKLSEHCYEIHVAAAKGADPRLVRQFVGDVGDHLTNDPHCRLVSTCPAKHRAAVRLNRHFLTQESEQEVDGQTWVTFGLSAQEWKERHGRRQRES